jgi:hypothetical protein
MRSSTVVRTILGLSLGVTLYASTAQAQPEDKRTYFTFSSAIALPGVTLPAGRYIFHIVDTTTSRKVIQVLSDDGKKPYAMMNTIPDSRREPAKDATVAFYETARGTPAAVKSWWYPGERDGYQFIYARTQAKQIAQKTGKPVLTTKTEDAKSATTFVDAAGKDVDAAAPDQAAASGFTDPAANATVFNRNTPAVTEGENRTPPQVAQNQPNPVPTQSSRVARNELPKTASNLPLVGLIGMLSALAFVTLRFGTSLRS